MARSLPSTGEPYMIEEILQRSVDNKSAIDGISVRVTGRLDEHDVSSCTAVITDLHSKKQLQLNTTLIEPFNAKLGSLFQFIGELESGQSVTLKARVVRCVDGLDMTMYKNALNVQREYLASRGDGLK